SRPLTRAHAHHVHVIRHATWSPVSVRHTERPIVRENGPVDAVNVTTLDRADTTRPRDPDAPVAPIERWIDRRVLVAGLVVAAVRFWFAVDRRVFHVVADEPGQLAMARWLSGGTRWNMFDHSTWRPGYSLVLAPIFWLV